MSPSPQWGNAITHFVALSHPKLSFLVAGTLFHVPKQSVGAWHGKQDVREKGITKSHVFKLFPYFSIGQKRCFLANVCH